MKKRFPRSRRYHYWDFAKEPSPPLFYMRDTSFVYNEIWIIPMHSCQWFVYVYIFLWLSLESYFDGLLKFWITGIKNTKESSRRARRCRGPPVSYLGRTGKIYGQCSEICGENHSTLYSTKSWLAARTEPSIIADLEGRLWQQHWSEPSKSQLPTYPQFYHLFWNVIQLN